MSLKTIPIQVVGKDIIAGSTTSASGAACTPAFRLAFNDEWDDLTGIIAKFTDARGDGGVTVEVTDLALDGNREVTVEVPAEAMAFEGMAELTIVGTKIETRTVDGVETEVVVERMTTKPYQFRVYESHWNRTTSNVGTITPTDKEQIMARVDVAEQYAKGTRNGVPVTEGQAGYHDNAKYYKELSETAKTAAETAQGKAEDAQAAAETAESGAQSAESGATTAQGAAETAQGAAEAAQSAAETAQGAAEQAASDAGASATTASTAAETARIRAEQALTARNQAVEARNDARSARDEAQTAQAAAETAQAAAETAQGKAEDAQEAAETAQGKAEDAQSAAESAQTAAETAQGLAEDAQGAAESAQTAAETAQAAAEAAAAEAAANKYAAFATEGVSSATRFRTILGADGIPTKTALVTQTAGDVPMDWTLRRSGKNQFDAATVTFKKGYNISTTGAEAANSAYAYTLPLIPVIPGARYVASGFRDRATDTSLLAGTYCTMCYYDSTGTFRARYGLYGANQNPVFTTPSIAAGDDYDCCFVRFYCSVGLVGDDNKIAKRAFIDPAWYDVEIQFEIVDNPEATAADATAYEPFSCVDYAVPIAALDTPTAPTEAVTTALGVNVFSLFPTSLPAVGSSISAAATMDLRARLDPTLVYNYLKTAIVAAGTT